jgi:hypothetical protein
LWVAGDEYWRVLTDFAASLPAEGTSEALVHEPVNESELRAGPSWNIDDRQD